MHAEARRGCIPNDGSKGSFRLELLVLPLTTKTIIVVGSYSTALYRNHTKPIKIMVLVVAGTDIISEHI